MHQATEDVNMQWALACDAQHTLLLGMAWLIFVRRMPTFFKPFPFLLYFPIFSPFGMEQIRFFRDVCAGIDKDCRYVLGQCGLLEGPPLWCQAVCSDSGSDAAHGDHMHR